MGRLLLFTVACVGIAFGSDRKPDFSGNWTLNLDQSNFGKSAKPNGMTLKVTREGDNMHAVQTTVSQVGPSNVESDWVLDGKEHDATSSTPGSATPGKLMTKWEGDTLYSERKSNDGTFLQKVWLTLSSDGKTAHEKVWTKGPEGTNFSNLIWERK